MTHSFRFRFLAAASLILLSSTSATAVTSRAVWSNPHSGTLYGNDFTISGLSGAALGATDMSGTEYSAAPLTQYTLVTGYTGDSDWTVTFAYPVVNLRVYLHTWWPDDPEGTFAFNHPFTIQSGLPGASVMSNTLVLPDNDSIYFGILEFAGPLTSLTVDATAPGNMFFMTFSVEVAGACFPGGRSPCTHAEGSSLQVQDKGGKTKLQWKWNNGTATLDDFGAPNFTNSYRLCVYQDGTLVSPANGYEAPAGGTCGDKDCWKQTNISYQYRNKELSSSGVSSLSLREGDMRAKIQLKAAPASVTLPPLPATGDIAVQLVSDEKSICYGAHYPLSSLIKNDEIQIKVVDK